CMLAAFSDVRRMLAVPAVTAPRRIAHGAEMDEAGEQPLGFLGEAAQRLQVAVSGLGGVGEAIELFRWIEWTRCVVRRCQSGRFDVQEDVAVLALAMGHAQAFLIPLEQAVAEMIQLRIPPLVRAQAGRQFQVVALTGGTWRRRLGDCDGSRQYPAQA